MGYNILIILFCFQKSIVVEIWVFDVSSKMLYRVEQKKLLLWVSFQCLDAFHDTWRSIFGDRRKKERERDKVREIERDRKRERERER